jgi:hypothetical protein
MTQKYVMGKGRLDQTDQAFLETDAEQVRQQLAAEGWRLMRRRKATAKNPDQYWLMRDQPLTLAQAAAISQCRLYVRPPRKTGG